MSYKILFLLLSLTFISVNQWSKYPIGNLWLTWIIQITLVIYILKDKKQLSNLQSKYLKWYFIWMIICVFRGFIIAENYLEYKQLITGSISLLCPIFLFLFYKPVYVTKIYQFWLKYALFSFFIFFSWAVGWTQFYLSPLLLLFCFFSLLKQKQAWGIFFLGLVYTLIEAEDSRAQFLKGGLSLLLGIIAHYSSHIHFNLIKLGHILCYASSIFLFTYILTDTSDFIRGKIDETDAINNNKEKSYSQKDTRSLIYIDAITSAIEHDYYLFGRTPARGNDINISYILFQGGYDDKVIFNKGERHRNEMLHLNILTWTGLLGVILYSLLYIHASCLAVYKSKNIYISLLGCYIAFRWSFGWIEETNTFMISDVAIWCMIGMCYSPLFRNMTNVEFKNWIRQLI